MGDGIGFLPQGWRDRLVDLHNGGDRVSREELT